MNRGVAGGVAEAKADGIHERHEKRIRGQFGEIGDKRRARVNAVGRWVTMGGSQFGEFGENDEGTSLNLSVGNLTRASALALRAVRPLPDSLFAFGDLRCASVRSARLTNLTRLAMGPR
jgi:hypothetical protein